MPTAVAQDTVFDGLLSLEVKSGPAVTGGKASNGGVTMDVNRDGAHDLYVVNDGQPNQLFLGKKNGGFVEQKSGPAVTGSKASGGAVILDANGDGWADLYVVNFDQPNQLYLNVYSKNGSFVEQKSGPAVSGNSYSQGAVAVDVSGDGWSDLYVVNRGQPNQLFINQGKKGGFVEQKSGPAVSGSTKSYGAVALDVNGDGAQE